MKKIVLSLGLLFSSASAVSAPTASMNLTMIDGNKCAVNSGITTFSSGCMTEPDEYKVTIHEVYLCGSAPSAPTTASTAVLSACQKIYDHSAGTEVSVSTSSSTGLSTTNFSDADAGTYTHAVVKLNNSLSFKSNLELNTSQAGDSSGAGVHCATVAGSTAGQTAVCGSSALTAGFSVDPVDGFTISGTRYDALRIVQSPAIMDVYTLTGTNLNASAANQVESLLAIVDLGPL